MTEDNSDPLRRLLNLALDSAAAMGHSYVGTEHLALAVIRAGGGGARALRHAVDLDVFGARLAETLGVSLPPDLLRTPDVDREHVESVFGGAVLQEPPTYPPYAPRAVRVLEIAAAESSAQGAPLDGEAVLVGLLDEGEGIAAQVLKQLGVDAGPLRARLRSEAGWAPLLGLIAEAEGQAP